ncbi:MAG: GIY-YIG nuclease family protein [Candidatus Moranbacteria bacterium]|nr:GIY-YIG nuclease family protein [Candidatus Moranbacteria bacterium]
MSYYLYILKCADGTLYTGITVDLKRRIIEHNSSALGAKYTRGRRPVTLIFSKKFRTRSTASVAESRIKKLSREEKLDVVKKYADRI